METREYLKIVDETLKQLTAALDRLNLDQVDAEFSDGKLVIQIESGRPLIVSRQAPVHQLWLAEPGGGWHFVYKEGKWICDKRGVELFQDLERLIGDQIHSPVHLS